MSFTTEEPDGAGRPTGRPLSDAFFARPADLVACDLIGKLLWRRGAGGGRLVEVEAYLPDEDPACHGARGKTPANLHLFGPPGTLYIYINYGLHRLMNIATLEEGAGTGVLLRAFEPLWGLERLRRNRGDETNTLVPPLIASGPGRLGQALAADLSLGGRSLGEASGIFLLDDGCRPEVEATPRIGLSVAKELRLRYIWPGSRYLSRPPRRGEKALEGREARQKRRLGG